MVKELELTIAPLLILRGIFMKIRILAIAVIFIMGNTIIGCSKQQEYSSEYDFNTDDQYSYTTDITSWRKYQSDGNGQYILMNNYIYYYNNETEKLTPLCDKANCLHDMETDKTRRKDCNAYIDRNLEDDEILQYDSEYKYIQYYEGDIYYSLGSSIYCVSKNGSSKKKIYTVDSKRIVAWMIHRGKLYYEVEEHYYEGENVYSKAILSQVDMGSSMKEKNAITIFETSEDTNLQAFGQLRAYKDKLVFSAICISRDFEMSDNESWLQAIREKNYIYDCDAGKISEIETPEKQSDTDAIGSIVFLNDKMLIKKYDNMQDAEYKTNIYSMDYDTKEVEVWLEGVAQDSGIKTYNDYVVIDDASIQYFEHDNMNSCNVEIYSSEGKKISNFEYELNSVGTFSGFGPDGISVDVTQNDTTWYVKEIKFEDVLECNGDKITPETVCERKFGELNNIVW